MYAESKIIWRCQMIGIMLVSYAVSKETTLITSISTNADVPHDAASHTVIHYAAYRAYKGFKQQNWLSNLLKIIGNHAIW